MRHFLFTSVSLLLLFCLTQCSIFDPSYYSEANERSGKCMAKCLIQDSYITEIHDLFIYTGEETNIDGVERQDFVVKQASSEWVKKKADKNCLSADPNDCLVWCRVETPMIKKELLIVTDTFLVKEFQIHPFTEYLIEKKGGTTEWRDVICDNQVNSNLVENIIYELISKGYLPEDYVPSSLTFNPPLKKALVLFQKENNLPIGSLDLETLDVLGVNY